MQKQSDSVLVMQFQSGDKKALAELVRRYHKTFCNKAYWITNDANTSKDIAQESWNVVIEKIEFLKEVESFYSWAMRIVYTKSLDWLRVKAKKRELQILDDAIQVETTETKDDDYINSQVLKAIKVLPIPQQDVIQLFYLEEYSLKKIGLVLGISVGTVKSRLFYAREQLKSTLKHLNYEN